MKNLSILSPPTSPPTPKGGAVHRTNAQPTPHRAKAPLWGVWGVCLILTTIFTACGGNKDDDDGNGDAKIDPKIVGKWLGRGIFDNSMLYHLHFNKDGTYVYLLSKDLTWGRDVQEIVGKYYTANGRIYFTESKNKSIEWNNGIIEPYNLAYSFANHDKYKTDVNKNGEYIKMYYLMSSGGKTPEELKEYMQHEYRHEYWRVE